MLEDDTFIANKDWAIDFAKKLLQSRLNYKWGCNVRADLVAKNPDLMAEMTRCGLAQVNMGIESASNRILEFWYNKNMTLEQINEAIFICKKLGLLVGGYFMFGAPTETRQEIMKTIEYASHSGIDEAAFNITTPLPATYLWSRTKDKVKEDFEKFDYYNHSVYKSTDVIPSWELNLYKKWAYFLFYVLDFKRFWNILHSQLISISGFYKLWVRIKRF